MRITTLVENTCPEDEAPLSPEFGLSLHVEVNGSRVLFDMGSSDVFLRNAEALGIDIAGVDAAVVSHQHFDHGGGLAAFFEVNDQMSYKQLQHLVALGAFEPGEVGHAVANGVMDKTGDTPVNISGGTLGMGHTMELDGGQRLLEVVLQLRGEAGAAQLAGVNTGLACGWRGIPTTTGAVAVLSN